MGRADRRHSEGLRTNLFRDEKDTTVTVTEPSSEATPVAQGPVLVTDTGAVRTLTLNRPAAFNSFNLELKESLLTALADAAAESAVRAVVITGAGRAFCAGQDLKEHLGLVAARDPRVARTVAEFYNPMVRAVAGMAKPVIAAVNGAAAGAGAGLAFACDLRIVARSATFSMAFAGVGLSADSGASFLLPRLVGYGRASKMMLLGEKVDSDEALRIGMVDRVVQADKVLEESVAYAAQFSGAAALAVRAAKECIDRGSEVDLDTGLEIERQQFAGVFATEDRTRGITSFVENGPGKATFVGR